MTSHRGEPSRDAAIVKARVRVVRSDGRNNPPVARLKCCAEIPLTDRVWTPNCALVAEAQHVQGSAERGCGREARRIFPLFLGIERVKESAVDDGAKLTRQSMELQSVGHRELSRNAATSCLLTGGTDRGRRHIDAQDIKTA